MPHNATAVFYKVSDTAQFSLDTRWRRVGRSMIQATFLETLARSLFGKGPLGQTMPQYCKQKVHT